MSFTPNPNFPQLSPLVTIGFNESTGRCIRAIDHIPAGHVVCMEKGITVNIKQQHCYNCLKQCTEILCKDCENINEPEELRNGTFDDLGIFKLAVHTMLSYPFQDIYRVAREEEPIVPNEAPKKLSTNDIDSIMQLKPMPQIGEALQMPDIQNAIRSIMGKIEWEVDEDMKYVIFCKVLRLLAERLAKNSHVVYDSQQMANGEQEPMGSGIFPIASVFNHSCTPNVHAFFKQNWFVFVSRRAIRKGEELVDSYGVDYYNHTWEERKQFLSNVSGFECNCHRCNAQSTWPLISNARMGNSLEEIKSFLKASAKQQMTIVHERHLKPLAMLAVMDEAGRRDWMWALNEIIKVLFAGMHPLAGMMQTTDRLREFYARSNAL